MVNERKDSKYNQIYQLGIDFGCFDKDMIKCYSGFKLLLLLFHGFVYYIMFRMFQS